MDWIVPRKKVRSGDAASVHKLPLVRITARQSLRRAVVIQTTWHFIISPFQRLKPSAVFSQIIHCNVRRQNDFFAIVNHSMSQGRHRRVCSEGSRRKATPAGRAEHYAPPLLLPPRRMRVWVGSLSAAGGPLENPGVSVKRSHFYLWSQSCHT